MCDHFFIVKEERDADGGLIDFDALFDGKFNTDFSDEKKRLELVRTCEAIIMDMITNDHRNISLTDMTIRVYDEQNDILGLFDFSDGEWGFCEDI